MGTDPTGAVPERPLIRGQRVWLRPVEEADLPAYCAAVNEYEPGWLAGYTTPQSLTQVRSWFDRVAEGHGREGYWFTICELGSREFVGQVWLWNLDQRVPGAEISIYVTTPGEGTGPDAIDAAVDFAFRSAGVRRVWGFTDEANARSLRAFERCGFVVEGRMRGASRRLDEPGDMIQFSMTVDDWRSLVRPRSWELNAAP